MTQAETFLSEIESFLRRTGMSASAFGRESVNDPNLVGDLRVGRMPSLGLVDRVHRFIQQNESPAYGESI